MWTDRNFAFHKYVFEYVTGLKQLPITHLLLGVGTSIVLKMQQPVFIETCLDASACSDACSDGRNEGDEGKGPEGQFESRKQMEGMSPQKAV